MLATIGTTSGQATSSRISQPLIETHITAPEPGGLTSLLEVFTALWDSSDIRACISSSPFPAFCPSASASDPLSTLSPLLSLLRLLSVYCVLLLCLPAELLPLRRGLQLLLAAATVLQLCIFCSCHCSQCASAARPANCSAPSLLWL